MNAWEVLVAGVAPHHVPALLAAVLVGAVLAVLPRIAALPARRETAAGWLLGVSAAVHVALPLGHTHGPTHGLGLTLGFVGSGTAYAWLSVRAYRGRSWRLAGGVLVLLTLGAYLSVLDEGLEQPDQVGTLTALAELFLLGLCLAPAQPRQPPRIRGMHALRTGAFLACVLVVGSGIWAAAWTRSGHAPSEHGVAGNHAHAGRAQAGSLELPLDHATAPTQREQRDAALLADRTRAELAAYADIGAAVDQGYRPTLTRTGYAVHLQRPRERRARHVLDPQNPEMLMYAVVDGRATLLSAVYAMPRAGVRGPTPGGPLTRWHTHNGCLSLLPPGLGVVEPFGSCPPLAVQGTLPVMMHVWVVDPPGGPFAEHVDEAWLARYHREHGRPFSW